MTSSYPARTPSRLTSRLLAVSLLVFSAGIGAGLGYQLHERSSAVAASPIDALRSEHHGAAPGRPPGLTAPAVPVAPVPRGPPRRGVPGEADGVVPGGTTVFDEDKPGVVRLNPALLGALRRAATNAANDGVTFVVTSGWRSPEYQHQLLREAISQYGSAQEAARWVATADTSPHVAGNAVDIDSPKATAWLSRHGATYGLCQIYRNEPWHYELRPEAVRQGCPPMYADPTHDPRMRQEPLPSVQNQWHTSFKQKETL